MDSSHHRIPKILLLTNALYQGLHGPALLSQFGKSGILVCPASCRVPKISIEQEPSLTVMIQPGKLHLNLLYSGLPPADVVSLSI